MGGWNERFEFENEENLSTYLQPKIVYRNTMQRMIWIGQPTTTMRKSLPSMMLFKSVETRLLIFPTRFPAFSTADFFSPPLVLALSASDGVASETSVAEAHLATSDPSGERLGVISAAEAVSGVEARVEDWVGEGEGSEGSDFMRTRKACSNTSWVMIP